MNKYLYKKLEQSHSVSINQIGFIAAELAKEKTSRVFEDFFELEFEEISECLGWRKEQEVYLLIEKHINDNDFIQFMYDNDCTGFIAECYFPVHTNFSFKENGSFSSCRVHYGISTSFWVYAESIGELVDKICDKSEKLFNEQMEISRKKQIENIEVKGETKP